MKSRSALFHLLVIIPGIALLQYHAILFWMDAVGVFTGIGWSLLIEIVSFWCWFQPRKNLLEYYFVKFLGFLTVILLLVGPLYTVSDEFVVEADIQLFDVSRRELFISSVKDEIERKQAQADRLLAVIEETEDGYMTFNKIEKEIQDLRETLRVPKEESPTQRTVAKRLPWQSVLVVLMQAIFIFIVQIVIILGILKLARFAQGEEPRQAPERFLSYKELLEVRSPQTQEPQKEEPSKPKEQSKSRKLFNKWGWKRKGENVEK